MSAACPRVEPVEVLAPRGHGIGLVEPEAERDELPETLDVGLAQHLAGPPLVRRADAAPVDGVLAVKPPEDRDRVEGDRAADALAVEVREQLRLRVSRRPDLRVPRSRLRRRLLPLGRVRERLVRPELDHRAPDVLILVADVHERRAGPIRLPCQRAHELGVLDEPLEEHLLARAERSRRRERPAPRSARSGRRSRELPLLVPDQRHLGPVGEHRIHLELEARRP